MKKILITTCSLLLLLMPVLAHADITSNLVGWWKFDEGSGTTAIDSSGNGNTGTLNGATYGTGKIGPYSLSFNGSSNVSVANSSSLKPNNVSLCAWFNASSFSAPITLISQAQTGPPWTAPYVSYLLRVNTSSQIEGDVGSASTYSNTYVNVSTLSVGVWYHFCMTYDGTFVSLYLNGSQVLHTTSAVSGNIDYSSDPIIIGADYSSSPLGDYMNGSIDDVRIYSRALSSSDVTQLYDYTGIQIQLQQFAVSLKKFIVKLGSGFTVY